jgi:hypothetical protein
VAPTPGGKGDPKQRYDQAQDQEAADRPQLGKRLEVERVRVVDGIFDRAVLVPGELVGPGPVAEDGLLAEGVDRHPPEVVTARSGEIGEVLLGIVGELDVGVGELVPGATADGRHRDDRDHGAAQGQPFEHDRVA